MPSTVVLIIDLLNDFFENSPIIADERRAIAAATNELTHTARRSGCHLIWIRQEFAPDLRDAPLEVRGKRIPVTISGTPGCQWLPELVRDPSQPEIIKKRYSAFFNTDLDTRLTALRCSRVVLAGINTHACIRTTAIDAYQRDYEVLIADDCTTSHDVEHHRVTKQYMNGKIAQFVANSQLSRILGSAVQADRG